MRGFKNAHAPLRPFNKRTNPSVDLRPNARISSKNFKLNSIPDAVPEKNNYLSREITKSEKNGGYKEEVLYRPAVKQINYYDDKNNKVKSTDIRMSAGMKKTTTKTYNAKGKVTHIEAETISVATGKKNVQKCDINPETDKITKYEMIGVNNKTFAMFERDEDGLIVTHSMDNRGNEFKHDKDTWTSTMTNKDGKTEEVSYQSASEFYSYIRPQIHIDMKKYL